MSAPLGGWLRRLHAPSRSGSALIAVVCVAAAALFRVCLLALYPFDGLYGQDAYFYLTATEELVKTWSEPSRLLLWLTDWGTPPVSLWPLGYHAQVALVSLFTGLNPLAGQTLSFVTGSATAGVAALLVLEVYRPEGAERRHGGRLPAGWEGALLGGLLVALAPLAAGSSLVFMSDTPALFWASLSLLLASRSVRDGRVVPAGALAAGVALGIAASTRYIYPLLLVPLLLLVMARIHRQRREALAGHKGLWLQLLPFVLPVAVLVGLQQAHNVAHPMVTVASSIVTSWNPLNAFGSAFDGPDGHLSYSYPVSIFYFSRSFLFWDAPGLLLPLIALGAVALLWQRKPFAWLILGWWALFVAFYSGTIYQSDRYVLSYLTPLAAIGGIGLQFGLGLARRLAASGVGQGRFAGKSAYVVILLAAVAVLVFSGREAQADFAALRATKQDYLQAARCVAEVAAGRGLQEHVYSFGVTFTISKYTAIVPRELFFETATSVREALDANERTPRALVVLPMGRFEEQWGATEMGAAFAEMRGRHTLLPLQCPGTTLSLFLVE